MKRAWTRFVFGQAQMAGATVAVYFLLSSGASQRTLIAVAATGGVSLVSLLIFRILWKERAAGKRSS